MNIRAQVRAIFKSDVADRGNNIYVNCPFCAARGKDPDSGYHLGISTNPRKLVVGCFRCGYRNTWKGLLAQLGFVIDDADDSAPDFEQITREFIYGPPSLPPEVIPDLMREYELTRCVDAPNSDIAKRCVRYLRGRGLDDEQIQWVDPCFSDHPRYLGRVVIPFYDADGVMEYFVARDIGKGPKKTNNPKTDKGELMYNFESAKRFRRVIITEGVFDALSVGRDAVALLGSVVTKPQLNRLVRARIPEIVVLLDADAVDKAINLFYTLAMGTPSRVGLCPLEEGDPNENRDQIRELIERNTLWGMDVAKLKLTRC